MSSKISNSLVESIDQDHIDYRLYEQRVPEDEIKISITLLKNYQ